MPEQKSSRIPLLICAALVAGVFLLYARVRQHEFMCYDDPLYVTENAYVQHGFSAEGVKWAFTRLAGTGTYWHPVTWMSHMLDWELFKADAGKHHIVNVLFHALNTVLLFQLLRRTTKLVWPGAIVAALFAFHPLQVDTVAWVAERKNVLSTLFWLLTMLSYVRYTEFAKANKPKAIPFANTVLLFVIGLMCKPMLVTLPCTLLLLDFWPLHRLQDAQGRFITISEFSKLLVEKIPLFILSATSSLITIKGHEQLGMIVDGPNLPLSSRLVNSVVAYATYLRKIFWPTDLAVFYPLPETWPVAKIVLSATIVIGISIAVIACYRKAPPAVFGWFWFLGTLVPVIGILQVHDQAMADRFVYVPLIGIAIALTWSIHQFIGKQAVLICGCIAVLLCAGATAKQIVYWKDCQTLMAHAAEVTKDNYVAYNNLGADYVKRGDPEQALVNYQRAVQSKNNYPMAHSNLGVIYAQRGDFDRAMQEFQTALQFDPDYADALSNAGRIYAMQGKMDLAIANYRHAIKMRPTHVDSHVNLGTALVSTGKLDEAIDEFKIATTIPPAKPDAFSNLGIALARKGRFDEAIAALNEALRIDPQYANSENNLGYIYELQNRDEEAAMHYQAALRLAPNHPDAMRNLQRLVAKHTSVAPQAKN